jgi:hypothetical protein
METVHCTGREPPIINIWLEEDSFFSYTLHAKERVGFFLILVLVKFISVKFMHSGIHVDQP